MKESTHKKKSSKATAKERLKSAKKKNFLKNNGLVITIIVILLLVGLGVSLLSSNNIEEEQNLLFGDDVIEMNYFHLSTCPHCHKQSAFHSTILAKYPNVKINTYEISQPGTREILEEIASQYPEFDITKFGTPTTFIGEEFNVGYGSDVTTGQKLLSMIEKEQVKIDANWDSTTMTSTIDLRLAQEDLY